MLAKNLKRAIERAGGTAAITRRDGMRRDPITGERPECYELSGELRGYDVHMFIANRGTPETGGNSYFTVRPIAQRGHNDPFSDYNPGGWTFCNRLRDLDWAAGS
jgi:hypothetical protein